MSPLGARERATAAREQTIARAGLYCGGVSRSARAEHEQRSILAGITVVIATRNRHTMLERAVASALGQQCAGQPQIIVVDDGSNVPVPPIDGAVVMRNPVGLGAAAARNRAIEQVRTPWIAFLDDDDIWAPDKLVRQAAALSQAPDADWCYTAAAIVDEQLSVVGSNLASAEGWIEADLVETNLISGGGSSVLARTETIRAAGCFDETLLAAEDWDLWVRLAARSKVVRLEEPLVALRRHASNKSSRWRDVDIVALDRKLSLRASELGLTARHTFLAHARIESSIARGNRRAAALAYFRRWRQQPSTRDAIACATVVLAPRLFSRIRRAAELRAIPTNWPRTLDWLSDEQLSPVHPRGTVRRI
jgi:glycosyltransferase involved in cell wall biosynthesis